MYNFIFLIQAETIMENSIFKDLIIPVVILIVTNIGTYLATRSKSKSEIGQIDAETLKTYLDIIKDIQENNQSLYEKLQTLRDKVENVDDMLDKAQTDLAITQKQLAACIESKTQILEDKEISKPKDHSDI